MIATLVMFGASTPLPRLAVLLAWGSVAGSALAVRRAAAGGPARGARSAVRVRSRRRCTSAQVVANFVPGVRRPRRRADQRVRRHAHREPAADRRGDRPGERPAPVHAAGQPVRHVGRRRGAAGDGRRGRSRRLGARCASRAARRRAAPDRVLRRAVGDRVPGVWRRDRGRAAADRPIPQRGRASTSGAFLPGRRWASCASTLGRLYSSTYYALHDTRTPLAFAVVRIGVCDGPRLRPRGPRSRGARCSARLGSGRPHAFRERCRLDRDAAASPLAERADRTHRPAGWLRRDAVVLGARGGGRGVGACELSSRRFIRRSPRRRSSVRSVRCISAARCWRGIPEAAALSRRIAGPERSVTE